MADLNDLHRRAAELRQARERARTTLRDDALELQRVERALVDARRRETGREPSRSVADLERDRARLTAAVDEGRRTFAATRERTIADLTPLVLDTPHLVAQLDDNIPFILFPLRIETKFVAEPAGPELWVRVFPDDIAVAHHEKELTAGEKESGEAYWRERARANGETGDARQARERAAWQLLGRRYGAYRASWVRLATQPSNWSNTISDPTTLIFPTLTTKPVSWSDVPRSTVMPDRFDVVLQRGATTRTVPGRFIPDDLPLGPDPLQAGTFMTRDATGRLSVPPDLRWLIDFKEAEKVGMGIRVSPLSLDEAAGGFDRMFVIGIRMSTSADESAALVAKLAESQRYSRGMAIVPQGAPTNNTDHATSGLSSADESVEETFALEHDPTPFVSVVEPMKQTDGQRLANALGLPLDAVRALPNARRLDIAESVAMNRALWSGTLGHFVKEMLPGVFSSLDVSRVRLFLNEFVHGRGTIPAIRVGAQPYGVLVTSAWDRWAWSSWEAGRDGDFWVRLHTQLGKLRQHWMRLAADHVPFVGRRDAAGRLIDPFQTLLSVIGLQATSVEFRARTGVPDSYIKSVAAYRGNNPAVVRNWEIEVTSERNNALVASGLPANLKAPLARTLFLKETNPVAPPLVDGDPVIPLSETRLIRPYDGVDGHNYIYWLANASSDDLQAERFVGADGALVNAPLALLYKLMRVAAVSELHTMSRAIAERMLPNVFVGAPAMTAIVNVAPPSTLMPAHYLQVDASKIGLTDRHVGAGDYLLEHARASTAIIEKPPEAAPLAALVEAQLMLAQVPTARLERLLAEHIDLVSYRLDAWLTATFTRRLARQRLMAQTPRTYIGAYGWVEDLRPSPTRQLVPPERIPAELGPAVDGPVYTDTDNGGFVHTPSMTHAVTAAVLRGGYLTHAENTPDGVNRMAVNLSSERVRTALTFLEGIQNGQDLGALLGYQLERGLHEGHPGVELDQYIYVLRKRFPLISKKLLPAPDDKPAEVVEARNVINGYDLLDHVKTRSYPYEIADLPSAGGPKARAITDEINRLFNAMDAIADLLLAESVHQVVQGNYARARGTIQALTEGERPPLPEIVQTPRSGKSLTHRVALFIDHTAATGWQASLTRRAAANAPLNHWLSTLLPAPATIGWMVKEGTAPEQFVDVTSLGLEPIDLILMSGERLHESSSLLERLIVHDTRESRAIADDVFTYFVKKPDPALPDSKSLILDLDRAIAGRHSLGSLHPLLKALRRIITGTRPLGAHDLLRPTEGQNAHPDNPRGYDGASPPLKDLVQLKTRIEAAHADLTTERASLTTLITTMAPLVDALRNDSSLAIQAAWTALIPNVRTQMRAILLFGVAEALPLDGLTISRPVVFSHFAQAEAVNALIKKRLEEARTLLDISFSGVSPDPDPAEEARKQGARVAARLDAYSRAGRLLLGDEFLAVPLFAAHADFLPQLSGSTIAVDKLRLESWLQTLSRVRPQLQAWNTVSSYHDWTHGTTLDFAPRQLPKDPGAKWIGGPFGTTVKADDVVSIATHAAPSTFTGVLAGLLIDEWTELVPAEDETSAMAVNVNRPNASAPQTVLIAVAPKQTGRWSWDDLVAILSDTLDRARLRAVEPDMIGFPYFQVLPTIVTAFNHSMLVASAKFSAATIAAAIKR